MAKFLAYLAIEAMRQLKQLVWAAGVALAFGTIIPYQAATLTAVAIWLGYATVPPGPLTLIARAS